MKIIIVVSNKNLAASAGMNKVISFAKNDLELLFEEVIIVSAKNLTEIIKGIIAIVKANPFTIDYIVFNSLASIRKSINTYWTFYYYISSLFKIKKAIYWHEMNAYYKNITENKTIENYFKNKKVKHLCVSNACSDIVDNFDLNAKKHIIYNCIDFKEIHSTLEYKNFTIVTIGTIQMIKGVDLWTEVAILTCKEINDVQFIWCGGVLEKELFKICKEKIIASGFQDRILFLGHLADASFILNASHVYFSSSRIDSMPLAVIEAMSFGKQIIYFESGGISEVLANEGILINNFNIIETKETIITLYKNYKYGDFIKINDKIKNISHNKFAPKVFANNFKAALQQIN